MLEKDLANKHFSGNHIEPQQWMLELLSEYF